MGTHKKTKYSENLIQQRLKDYFMTPNNIKYIVENLYIYDWESDLWIYTKSDVAYEFEIKITKADFKNDFKHKEDKHYLLENKMSGNSAYDIKYYRMLEESRKRGNEDTFLSYVTTNPKQFRVDCKDTPNFFYYAVPENMVEEKDVPEYAGLIYMVDCYPYYKIIKKAPQITKDKNDLEFLNLRDKFYFNYRENKDKILEEKEKSVKLQEEIDEMTNKPDNERITYEKLKAKYEHAEKMRKVWENNCQIHEKELSVVSENARYDNRYIHYLQKILKNNNIDFKSIYDFEK